MPNIPDELKDVFVSTPDTVSGAIRFAGTRMMMEVFESEARWQKRFQETPRTLMKIAERAKWQYEAGECSDFNTNPSKPAIITPSASGATGSAERA